MAPEKVLAGYRLTGNPKSGFVLGMVLLCLILVAIFVFSYNNIVRHENLRSHHEKISSITESLARSGALLLNQQLEKNSQIFLQSQIKVLKEKTAEELGSEIGEELFEPIAAKILADYQKFLNASSELFYQESGMNKAPVCNSMKISLTGIKRLSTFGPANRAHDPIEKHGEIIYECEVEYRGLIRRATLKKCFRIVNMVPGPFARFSLFVSQTPFSWSYNCFGVDLSGKLDVSFQHPLLKTKVFAPLFVFNGTDSLSIDDVAGKKIEKKSEDDRFDLLHNGWIFIGPIIESAPPLGVYLNIPAGMEGNFSGHFMLGWPENGVLVQQKIVDDNNFKNSAGLPDLDYFLAESNYGYYTGKGQSVGETGLWPGFAANPKILSASSWLYPYGSRDQISRTLMVGDILAGYLKLSMLKAKDSDFKIIFKTKTESEFQELINQDETNKITSLGLFKANHAQKEAYDGLKISDFFLNGYDSFKWIAPFNSCQPTNYVLGIAFNAVFDFMKYDRTTLYDPTTPLLSGTNFDQDKIRICNADKMRNNNIKGILPHYQFSIFFKENSSYSHASDPDNCYFYGDLSQVRVAEDNKNSNLFERVCEIIDLTEADSIEAEDKMVEKALFSQQKINGQMFNVPRKAGIFYVVRKPDTPTDLNKALRISSKKIMVTQPFIVLINRGSLILEHDIDSTFKDQAPEKLASFILEYGDFFLSGQSSELVVCAYLAALGNNVPSDSVGRLLSSGKVNQFEINGGLAVKEIGLHNDANKNNQTTITNFPMGGIIRYNSRFNPSLSSYADAYELVVESGNPNIVVSGGAL